MMKFEYKTVKYPYNRGLHTPVEIEPPRSEGWERVWADVLLEGIFAVYRREIPTTNENEK